MSTAYYDIPQPQDIPEREKQDAMGAYLMMFAAWGAGLPLPIINAIAAVIYYFVNKGKSRFVKFHALQSMLAQLPTTFMNAGLVFWTVRNFHYDLVFDNMYWGYLALVVIANILYIIFSLIACFRAKNGRFFYFTFFGPLSYHYAYRIVEQDEFTEVNQNAPPKM